MKKIIALLMAVMMVVGLFAGCADTGSNNNNGTTTAPAGNNEVTEVTLKVWAPQEDQADDSSWLKVMLKKFEEAHPEYKITWELGVCGEGDAKTNVATDPSAAADVYMYANDQLGALVEAGALTELGGDYLAQVQNDVSATYVNTVTHTDGGVYGFPVAPNTWFLYYNKETYTEEDVKSLNTMLEKGKVAFPLTTGWYTGSFFMANGGTLFGDQGVDGSAGVQFGEANGGYEAALTMVELFANPNFINDADVGQGGLKEGTIDAFFSGSWVYADLYAALGDNLGAAQLPTVEIGGQQKQMKSFAGSKAIGVNPHASNPKVAMELAAFLASSESQLLRFQLRGITPAVTALAEDEAVKSSIVAMAENNTMANTSVAQPSIPEMDGYWSPVQTFGENIVSGAITKDNYKEQVDLMMGSLNGDGL